MGKKDLLYGTKEKYKKKAKKKGFASRSAFKLIDINKQFSIIKKEYNILDLGYWPGGWLKYASSFGGVCVGIDIKDSDEFKDNPKVILLKKDIFSPDIITFVKQNSTCEFDAIISDMMANTTGQKDVDNYNSFLLAEQAFNIAIELLKKEGNFVAKIFESQYTEELVKEAKKEFKFVKIFKPKSSRDVSREVYVVCKGKL